MKKFYVFMAVLVVVISTTLATVEVAQAKSLNEAIVYNQPEYSGEIANPMVRMLTRELDIKYGRFIKDVNKIEPVHMFYCTFRQQQTSEGVRYIWVVNGMCDGTVRRDYMTLTLPDIQRLLGIVDTAQKGLEEAK